MKCFFIFLAVISLLSFTPGIQLSKEIVFQKSKFTEIAKDPKEGYAVYKEFLHNGDNPANFTQKLIVQVEDTDLSFDEIIREMQKELAAKTKNKYTYMEEMTGQSFVFSYTFNNPTKNYTEFNVLKITMVDLDGTMKPAYITYKIRGYADDIPSFNAYIKESSNLYVEEMRAFKI